MKKWYVVESRPISWLNADKSFLDLRIPWETDDGQIIL